MIVLRFFFILFFFFFAYKKMTSNSKRKELLNDIKKTATWVNDFSKIYETELTSMEQEVEDLEKRKKELIVRKKVIDVTTIPDTIILNLGGMKYQTTKEILHKVRGSYFD